MEKTIEKHQSPLFDVGVLGLGDHVEGCEKIRSKVHRILTHRQTREYKVDLAQENINKLGKYIGKHKELFSGLLEKHPELKERKYQKNKLNIYLKDFFLCIENGLSLGIKYEQVVSHSGEIIFNEALLRVTDKSGKNNFNHLDYLEIYNTFGLSFSVFFNVLYNVFSDIKSGIAKKPVSINVEISDITHPDFINTIRKLENHFNIKLGEGDLLLEVLENQKIPRDCKLFIQRIKELQNLGIHIALDDTVSKQIPYESVLNNISTLSHKNIKVVKIDGKTIHSLFNIYQAMGTLLVSGFNNLKEELDKIRKEGIHVVAEWVESIDMLNFVNKYLGIDIYQGFHFNNPNAIGDLKEEYVKQN